MYEDSSPLHREATRAARKNEHLTVVELSYRMIQEDPSDVRAYGRLAQALYLLKKHPDALQAVDHSLALQGYPQGPPSQDWIKPLHIKTSILMAQREYEQALQVVDFILNELSPRNKVSLDHRAELYEILGQSESAQKSRHYVTELRILQLIQKAKSHMQDKEWNLAQSTLASASGMNPEHPGVLAQQTHVFLEQNDLPNALKSVERELKARPQNRIARGLQVRLLLLLKKPAMALRAAQALPLHDPLKYFYMVSSYAALDQWTQVLTTLEKAPHPLSPDLLWKQAQAFYQLGQRRKSRESLIQLIQSSRVIDYRALATLIRISVDGQSSPMDPAILTIMNQLSSIEKQNLQKVINDYSKKGIWTYSPQTPKEPAFVSYKNDFWEGLNSTAIDSQTRRATY